MALPPPKVRHMSNGMPVDLYVAVQKLRIYGVILLAASLFFLGWSIISYFIAEPLMAFYGMGSFGCSTLTAIFFLTNRIATSGWKGRLNVVCTHLANSGYFAVAALYGHNVSYGMGMDNYRGDIIRLLDPSRCNIVQHSVSGSAHNGQNRR